MEILDGADGLQETYTTSVSVAGNGQVWTRHGAVQKGSVLDGYSVLPIPEPRQALKDDPWSGRVYVSASGTPWTTSEDGLLEFADGKWVLH